MPDLTRIEEQLIEARDALISYWEQPEGQACFLALQVVEDAFADYRALDDAGRGRDSAQRQRIAALVEEINRLRAPLADAL
jgi:hypothetical protein